MCVVAIKFSGVANYDAKVRSGRALDPNEPSLIEAIKSQHWQLKSQVRMAP